MAWFGGSPGPKPILGLDFLLCSICSTLSSLFLFVFPVYQTIYLSNNHTKKKKSLPNPSNCESIVLYCMSEPETSPVHVSSILI